MTTSPLDDQLRAHYASFRRDHGRLRDGLMDQVRKIDTNPSTPHKSEPSRYFNRRLLMRISAAASVAIAVGVAAFFLVPGSSNITWADVVKAMGPIESIQYRTDQRASDGDGSTREATENLLTADAERVERWHYFAGKPASLAPKPWEQTEIVLRRGRESTSYYVEREQGRLASITQVIDYTSPTTPPHPIYSENRSQKVLAMWRRLQDLPPEAVLKRGSVEIDGATRLRFQVLGAGLIPGLGGYESGVFALVDPKTKRPIQLQAGDTKWTDVQFNPVISADRFTPPAVPDDLDAEVVWSFTLPVERPGKEKFAFRVLDSEAKPIVAADDLRPGSESGGGQGLFGGSRANEVPDDHPTGEWVLTADGVNQLDRFMARNPGATMTIEIAGEPAIKRTVYGRLSRERPPVVLRLLTPADIRATTQPTQLFKD